MGNVPTKEQRSRSSSLTAHSLGSGSGPRSSRRHTVLSLSAPGAPGSGLFGHKPSKSEDKLKIKERQLHDLLVRHTDCVDGGYLAPYGTYKLNLDYNTEIVRGLVVARRLAPFFTPLQDFDADWTDAEVLTLVRQSPLHALDAAYSASEDDDADDHKIHRSQNFYRRQEQKKREKELAERTKDEQRALEGAYLAAKSAGDRSVPLRELVLKLYRHAAECPICFLFYPPYLNYSRCCRQPICTECFVQIKRLDPHPPHDEPGDKGELPHQLISEAANCPYCAMDNFGVTYDPPVDIHVGLGAATAPGTYAERRTVGAIMELDENAVESSDETSAPALPSKLPHFAAARKPRRRLSVAADAEGVITTDAIRPDWESKLATARSKLARKAAAANTIHASNLILNEGSSTRAAPPTLFLDTLEDRMVEEAMRLSLLDEERRKKASTKDAE